MTQAPGPGPRPGSEREWQTRCLPFCTFRTWPLNVICIFVQGIRCKCQAGVWKELGQDIFVWNALKSGRELIKTDLELWVVDFAVIEDVVVVDYHKEIGSWDVILEAEVWKLIEHTRRKYDSCPSLRRLRGLMTVLCKQAVPFASQSGAQYGTLQHFSLILAWSKRAPTRAWHHRLHQAELHLCR